MRALFVSIVVLFLLALPVAAQTPTPVPYNPTAPRDYTVTTGARVRACPRVSCASIGSVRAGTTIRVYGAAIGDRITGTNATWYAVTLHDQRGFIYSGLVRPATGNTTTGGAGTSGNSTGSGSVSTPVPAPISTPVPAAPGYACNCQKTCGSMTCDEAYFQLNQCGCSQRDADSDGVPCESICPGG